MNRLRKIIFWCHLPVGVIAGIVILIMSVTGVLLAYERQIKVWADTRSYRAGPPSPGAKRLSVETLLARMREAQPDITPLTFTLQSDPAAPATFGFTAGLTIFVNPYTGEVLGEGPKQVRGFFRAVTDLHRWLGAQGSNRAAGRAITGVCNLGFLFLVVSGFYLWWPKRWGWSQISKVLWFNSGLAGKARDFNWHNVIGFWCAAPLFVIVLSAVVISYQWAGNLVYRIVGETPPAPRGASLPSGATPQPGEVEGIERLFEHAEQQTSGWQSIGVRLPASVEETVTFTIDNGNGGQPQDRAQLTLNRITGEVVRWEPFSSYTTGRQVRSILRFAHTGEIAGILGQTIAGLVSAGSAVLVWSGLMLALRRFLSWKKRARSEQALSHSS
jgi:uncharacterized iron-regulated membrane protein